MFLCVVIQFLCKFPMHPYLQFTGCVSLGCLSCDIHQIVLGVIHLDIFAFPSLCSKNTIKWWRF
jgi:hypothetical protein